MEITFTETPTANIIREQLSNVEVVQELQDELNKEIQYSSILRGVARKRDAGIIHDSCIKFCDLPDERKNETYVYLGRSLEDILLQTLSRVEDLIVRDDRSSSGDLVIGNKTYETPSFNIWEEKGTSGEYSWTGSTHATRKEDQPMNFLGIKYDINKEVNIFNVIDGHADLVKGLFIGVFEDLKLVRKGTATSSSSRTSLMISIDDYEKVKEEVAWGTFRLPKGSFKKDGSRGNAKYLYFLPGQELLLVTSEVLQQYK